MALWRWSSPLENPLAAWLDSFGGTTFTTLTALGVALVPSGGPSAWPRLFSQASAGRRGTCIRQAYENNAGSERNDRFDTE